MQVFFLCIVLSTKLLDRKNGFFLYQNMTNENWQKLCFPKLSSQSIPKYKRFIRLCSAFLILIGCIYYFVNIPRTNQSMDKACTNTNHQRKEKYNPHQTKITMFLPHRKASINHNNKQKCNVHPKATKKSKSIQETKHTFYHIHKRRKRLKPKQN